MVGNLNGGGKDSVSFSDANADTMLAALTTEKKCDRGEMLISGDNQ